MCSYLEWRVPSWFTDCKGTVRVFVPSTRIDGAGTTLNTRGSALVWGAVWDGTLLPGKLNTGAWSQSM